MSSSRASIALVRAIENLTLPSADESESYICASRAPLFLGDSVLDCFAGLDPDHMTDVQSVHRLVEVAKMIDCVQDGSPIYRGPVDGVAELSSQFQEIAKKIEFAPAAIDDAAFANYQHAMQVMFTDPPWVKTREYAQFCELRAKVASSEIALDQRRSQGVLEAGSESTIDELADSLDNQKNLLEALDLQYEFRLAEGARDLAEQCAGALPETVTKSLQQFDIYRVTDANTNATCVVCDFFPSAVSEEAWMPITLSKAEIAEHAAQSDSDQPVTIISGVPDANIESVSLEVQVLRIHRPWFWSGLFSNRTWRWTLPSMSPVSNGPNANGGMIPAFVSGVVLARNVVVFGPKPQAQTEGAIRMHLPLIARTAGTQPVNARGATRSIAARIPTRHVLVRPTATSPMIGRTLASRAGLSRHRVTITPRAAGMSGIPVAHGLSPAATPFPAALLRSRLNILPEFQRTLVARRLPTFSGRIQSESGRGLANALVQLKARSGGQIWRTRSGPTGKFSITGMANVRCDIKIQLSGFQTYEKARIGAPTNNQMFRLKRPAGHKWALSVRLTQIVGSATEAYKGSATVLVRGTSNAVVQSAFVQHLGEAHFALPRGTYQVEVKAPGATQITPAQATLTVTADRTLEFGLSTNILLAKPDPHILGFLCQRVPLSPNPDAGVFG